MAFCTSCVNVVPPVTTFKRYEVAKINLVSADFNFIFDIKNPNDIPLNVKDIEYTFKLEGTHVLGGKSKGFELHAKETKEILIPIRISYLGALESVTMLVKKLIIGNKKLKYKLEGYLVIESLGATAKTPLYAAGELTLIN
ncbi:LEA type 2 family protein [Candidatus Margulisiibacteriota bacterium]